MSVEKDKYLVTEIDNETDEMMKEARLHQRYYEKKHDFSKMDSIQCSEQEIYKLSDVVYGMNDSSCELIENPAMQEFELTVKEPAPSTSSEITVARFKKTILKECQGGKLSGSNALYYPQLDVFISFWNADVVDVVMTVSTLYEEGKEKGFGTGQEIIWMREGLSSIFNENYKELIDICRNIKIAYLSIQKAMRDKPTVFTVASKHPVYIYGKSSGTNSKRNHAKVVRTICINRDELEKQQHGHHEITCPCWGVVGHWRTYKKTGKRVWVAPYRKGKQRDNPDAYHPKDYEFVGGGSDDT